MYEMGGEISLAPSAEAVKPDEAYQAARAAELAEQVASLAVQVMVPEGHPAVHGIEAFDDAVQAGVCPELNRWSAQERANHRVALETVERAGVDGRADLIKQLAAKDAAIKAARKAQAEQAEHKPKKDRLDELAVTEAEVVPEISHAKHYKNPEYEHDERNHDAEAIDENRVFELQTPTEPAPELPRQLVTEPTPRPVAQVDRAEPAERVPPVRPPSEVELRQLIEQQVAEQQVMAAQTIDQHTRPQEAAEAEYSPEPAILQQGAVVERVAVGELALVAPRAELAPPAVPTSILEILAEADSYQIDSEGVLPIVQDAKTEVIDGVSDAQTAAEMVHPQPDFSAQLDALVATTVPLERQPTVQVLIAKVYELAEAIDEVEPVVTEVDALLPVVSEDWAETGLPLECTPEMAELERVVTRLLQELGVAEPASEQIERFIVRVRRQLQMTAPQVAPDEYIDESMRERITGMAAAVGYSPLPKLQSLRTIGRMILGLPMLPQLTN